MFGKSASTRARRTLSAVCVAAAFLAPAGLAAAAAADPIPQADGIYGVYQPSPQWCLPQFAGWQPPLYGGWQPPIYGGWQPPLYGGWQQPVYGGGYDGGWYGGQEYGMLPLIMLGSAALY